MLSIGGDMKLATPWKGLLTRARAAYTAFYSLAGDCGWGQTAEHGVCDTSPRATLKALIGLGGEA